MPDSDFGDHDPATRNGRSRDHHSRDHDDPGEERRGRRHPPLALDPPMPEPAHPPEIPTERLDPEALKVTQRLRHMGHHAYLVGGCVRDLLLGRQPKDFDVATSAHPGEVRATFRNCRLIGRRFRLAHVYFRGGKVIEVATFRANPVDALEDLPDAGDLLITRDNVFGTAEEDARRRDFTVNGLFYDVALGEVIDYVGGRADLEAHRIATIGDPEIRMREDPVRALRAVRFAARLGFTIAPDTFAAMKRHASEIGRCAPPRVLEEIFKILRCGASARAFELLRASGALQVILPALWAALEASGEEGRRRFGAHLAALDRLVRAGDEISEAVLLGALLMHLRAAAGEGESQDDPAQALLAELVGAARLPRRVAERTRLALHAQRSVHAPAQKKRRRRRGGLASQAYFEDALALLELSVEATGEGREELERWKAECSPRKGHGHGHAHGHGPHAHGHVERDARERRDEGALGPEAEPPLEADQALLQVEAGEDAAATGPDERAEADEDDAGGRAVAGEAGEKPSAEGAPKRRRRRRGGRRRRRRGGAAQGAAAAATGEG